MNLFGSASKATSKNSSFLSHKQSLSINANAPLIHSPDISNTELFLRHRAEEYLANLNADTALFFAERLLSEHDCLGSRLLVAKCYHQRNQFNRAYHVLQRVLRQRQTEYQVSLLQQYNKQDEPTQMNQLNISGKTTPFTQCAITPRGTSDLCYTPIHLDDNASGNVSEMGFNFATPIAHANAKGNGSTSHQQNSSNLQINHSMTSNGSSHLNLSSFQNHNIHNGSMGAETNRGSIGASPMYSGVSGIGAGGSSFISTIGSTSNLHGFNQSQLPSTSTLSAQELAELSEARYFLATICFELARFDECEEVLMGKKSSDSSKTPELRVPNGVHGLFLLAKVFRKSSRLDMAADYFRKCIQCDSYHLGAILALSEMGVNPGLQTMAMDRNATTSSLALQSKHCVVPKVKDQSNGNGKEEADERPQGGECEMVPLEKEDPESYNAVKTLFEQLSWGYYRLKMYEPQDALRYFVKLSPSHQASAWCLNNKARCYYEMNDYQRAIEEWKKQVELYPYDMKGMDYYSTALWHLKMSKELTLLSQHCSEYDKRSASTWMVMGNCFSMHKSHDLAIKFFKKAYCTKPDYAYAHTLSGHEYVVNEDFDAAMKSFQTAIRLDARHYNAWYGLATIYQFQQNYKDALYHFEKARKINPNSSVLLVCIGNIFKVQSQYKMALKHIDKALKLTRSTGHHNLKARLERANILILTKRYRDAIDEFTSLLQIIPNEWKIHFHLGEVLLKIGEKDKALQEFTKAMALNPKDKNTIKHAIQNIYSVAHSVADYQGTPMDRRGGSGSGSGRAARSQRPRGRGRGDAFYHRSIVEEAEEDDEKETDEEMDSEPMSAPMDEDVRAIYDDANFSPFERGTQHESVDAVGPTHSNSVSSGTL